MHPKFFIDAAGCDLETFETVRLAIFEVGNATSLRQDIVEVRERFVDLIARNIEFVRASGFDT